MTAKHIESLGEVVPYHLDLILKYDHVNWGKIKGVTWQKVQPYTWGSVSQNVSGTILGGLMMILIKENMYKMLKIII